MVLLTPVDASIETPDGKVSPIHGARGDVFWSEGPLQHRGTNTGSAAFELVVVEVK
jgi:hypothetical protein